MMPALSAELATLYRRDLARLLRQLDACPDDALWQMRPGVTNTCGNLMLHLNGNLREYVGRQLGGVAYARNRAYEFSATAVPRETLVAALAELAVLIPNVIEGIPEARWDEPFPEDVLGHPMTCRAFVVHLFGHLGYHLGQIDYLRRVCTGQGPLAR